MNFRSTTTELARHLGSLTGHVRNSSHDTVLGEVQGSRDKIDAFVRALEGSPAGKVERVQVESVEEVARESGFRQT